MSATAAIADLLPGVKPVNKGRVNSTSKRATNPGNAGFKGIKSPQAGKDLKKEIQHETRGRGKGQYK